MDRPGTGPERCHLRILAAGFTEGIEITRDEFQGAISALELTRLAGQFETRLDLLIETLFEYERSVLEVALRHSLFPVMSDERVDDEQLSLSRRAAFVLTAARMYLDQGRRLLCRMARLPGCEAGAWVRDMDAATRAEYGKSLDYRIGETLRNWVQHRGLPVQWTSWRSAWKHRPQSGSETTEGGRLETRVEPALLVDELFEEGGIKPAVLTEMKSAERNEYPLTPVLRGYVEGLGHVHAAVQRQLGPAVAASIDRIAKLRSRASDALGISDLTGLHLTLTADEATALIETHSLSLRSARLYQRMATKNKLLGQLSRRMVVSEYPPGSEIE